MLTRPERFANNGLERQTGWNREMSYLGAKQSGSVDALTQLWEQAVSALGAVTILLLLLFFLSMLFIAVIVALSIRNHKFYFPRFILASFSFADRVIRGACRLVRLNDAELSTFFVNLHNRMTEAKFSSTAIEDRAIFLPHCLRSAKCPADLTPEGLVCKHCGKCPLDGSTKELEGMGYRVFIVPGSTFVGRMAKKYRYKAMIGVGCPKEIRDGLRSADKIGLVAMGVVNKTDGCIETIAEWPELRRVASLKTPSTE
jgi:hypothetical protein